MERGEIRADNIERRGCGVDNGLDRGRVNIVDVDRRPGSDVPTSTQARTTNQPKTTTSRMRTPKHQDNGNIRQLLCLPSCHMVEPVHFWT